MSLLHFPIFPTFFQVKTVNPYEDEIIFLDTQHLLKENIPYQYFHHNLL